MIKQYIIKQTHPKERNDVVLGNSLQKPWGSSKGLQTSTHSGKEGANDNNPWRRPGQSPYNQVFIDCVSKSASRRTLNMTNNTPQKNCSNAEWWTQTYLSLRTTPSIQAPNKTTELKSKNNRSRSIIQYKAVYGYTFFFLLVCTIRIQTSEVVVIAKIVPTGMDFWASRRSPDLLEPAMIPTNKKEIEELKSKLKHTLVKLHPQLANGK